MEQIREKESVDKAIRREKELLCKCTQGKSECVNLPKVRAIKVKIEKKKGKARFARRERAIEQEVNQDKIQARM